MIIAATMTTVMIFGSTLLGAEVFGALKAGTWYGISHIILMTACIIVPIAVALDLSISYKVTRRRFLDDTEEEAGSEYTLILIATSVAVAFHAAMALIMWTRVPLPLDSTQSVIWLVSAIMTSFFLSWVFRFRVSENWF